jgi:hypothetical protein
MSTQPMKDVFIVTHTGQDASTAVLSATEGLDKAVERVASLIERADGLPVFYLRVGTVEFLGTIAEYRALQAEGL